MEEVEQRALRRDLITGLILLVFALAWTWTVYETVPPARGAAAVGPRDFPLYLGLGLVALSGIMVLFAVLRIPLSTDDPETSIDGPSLSGWRLVGTAAMVCAIFVVYGLLMQPAGFLLATALIVAGTLLITLGERRPLLVTGMTVGITAGCWLVFGKLLGAYMPRGMWLSALF